MRILGLVGALWVGFGLTLAACRSAPVPVSEPPLDPVAPIWVVQTFTGGRQCHPGSYTPPDVAQMLGRVGVVVLETRVEPLAVCHACDICPAYSADHFVLIDPEHLESAQAAGFSHREE